MLSRSPQQRQDTVGLLSPLISDPTSPQAVIQSSENNEFSEEIDRAVNDALVGSQGTYSVVVKDLQTGDMYTRNADQTYATASLYKLWTMAVVYQFIEEGRLQKDQVLSATVADLNEAFSIPPEEAERTEGEITMTISEALERMITVSENYPAHLLTREVGLASLNSFLANKKLTESSTGSPPKTTANDLALFYEKLYRGEIVSKASSEEMIELLKRQTLNDRIPKYLPKSVEVAHKTGELGSVKHDAGIIYTDKGDYIMIFLSESSNQLQAAERIAMMADNIYTYLAS